MLRALVLRLDRSRSYISMSAYKEQIRPTEQINGHSSE